MKKIHIGSKIKLIANQKGIGATELGAIVNLTRNVIYHIYGRESINTDLLFRLSSALDHNFFQYLFKECENRLKTARKNSKTR